jgi:hypothetical protein
MKKKYTVNNTKKAVSGGKSCTNKQRNQEEVSVPRENLIF